MDKHWLETQYETRSMESIADELGVHRNTVRNAMIRFGIPRRVPGEHFLGVPKSEQQRKKMSRARKEYWDSHPATDEFKLKISKSKTKYGIAQGRRRVYVVGRGQVHDYTLVVEGEIARKLSSDEVIHHIDGNPLNSSPENLQVLTKSEHARLHSAMRRRNDRGEYIS